MLKSEILEEYKRLERAKMSGFDPDTVWYHVSNNDFDFFDESKSQDGSFWLTKDLDSIKQGVTGASLDSEKIYIHEFFIKMGKFAGWDEQDLYFDEQLIEQGYIGVILDNDVKIFDSNNLRKANYHFNRDISELNINEMFNSEVVFYHGNENKVHKFSEYRPPFFTSDKDYAKEYGDYVYPYTIETKKPFDTATNEEARMYYNECFLNSELGENAKKIEKGQHITENDADNFWAFIAVEALENKIDYDAIIVRECAGISFTTDLSIVPFKLEQIKPLNKPELKYKTKPKN